MSSRVYSPGDPHCVGAGAWSPTHVRPPATAAPASDPAAAAAARIAALERECGDKVREARAAGQRDGEAASRTRAAAELQPLMDRLARTLEELAGMRGRLRREAEADTVKLALAIARRVLRRELAIDPEALHGLVLAALEKLEGQEACRVRLHPAQAGAVRECLRQAGGAGASIEVVADASREPGSAVFETARGNLDASIETQLQEIERGLADCLRRRT